MSGIRSDRTLVDKDETLESEFLEQLDLCVIDFFSRWLHFADQFSVERLDLGHIKCRGGKLFWIYLFYIRGDNSQGEDYQGEALIVNFWPVLLYFCLCLMSLVQILWELVVESCLLIIKVSNIKPYIISRQELGENNFPCSYLIV